MASGEFGGFDSQHGVEGDPFVEENWGGQWTGRDEDRPVALDDEQGSRFVHPSDSPTRLQYPEHLAPEIGEE